MAQIYMSTRYRISPSTMWLHENSHLFYYSIVTKQWHIRGHPSTHEDLHGRVSDLAAPVFTIGAIDIRMQRRESCMNVELSRVHDPDIVTLLEHDLVTQ